MKRNFIFVLLLFFSWSSHAQGKLTKVKVAKEVEVRVPAEFTILGVEEIFNKYINTNEPLVVYGNPQRTADFAITKNPTRWKEKDSEILIDFYKSSITSTYTKVIFHQEKLIEMNGQRFIVLEFTSSFKDTNSNALATKRAVNKYTYLLYALRNESLYVFNFSAPSRERSRWEATAAAIMKSIRFQ